MRPRNLIAAFAALAALAVVPAVASASLSDQIYAGDKVEQLATRNWPAYNFAAYCNQQGRTTYWCTVSGQHNNCFIQGHANATITHRGYWINSNVWLRGMNRTCF
jgi:hypothetical protein